MADQRFITIDVGRAWTKVFLVNCSQEEKIEIEKSARLPTSWGDLPYAVNALLARVGESGLPKIFVSHLPQVEKIAKDLKGNFVTEELSLKALTNFLKVADSELAIIDGGVRNLLAGFSAVEVGKFLSFPVNEIYLENFFGVRKIRLHNLPKDTKELEIEEALLRTKLLPLLAKIDRGKKVLIVATGGIISGTPKLSRLGLVLTDVLDKGVVAQVFFDREFFLPSFGALLACYEPLQVADPGAWFESLGALVSLGGASTLTLDWGYSQVQKVEIGDGELSLIPTPSDQKIKLTLLPEPKKTESFTVLGGSLGILLDGRSKPLPLSFASESSRGKIVSWRQQIEKEEISKEVF